jgi:alpha-1,3-glucosyltransferase
MRGSVVVAEVALVAVLAWWLHGRRGLSLLASWGQSEEGAKVSDRGQMLAGLLGTVLLHPGLVLVDHVHFQYNGALLAGLIAVIALAARDASPAGALWLCAAFAALVSGKHLFVVLGPCVSVYLLAARLRSLRSLVLATAVVVVLLAVVWGPVLWWRPDGITAEQQARQVLARLFPFGRGLIHAYPAGNAWALYTLAWRVAVAACKRIRLPGGFCAIAAEAGSGGVWPWVTPAVCAAATLAAMAPVLWSLWRLPTPRRFHVAMCLCYLAAFAFGWHAHEKAMLYACVPALLLLFSESGATDKRARERVWIALLSAATCAAQLPLVWTPVELPVATVLAMAGVAWWCHAAAADAKFAGWGAAGAAACVAVGVCLAACCVAYALQPTVAPQWQLAPLLLISGGVAVAVAAVGLGWGWQFVSEVAAR